MGRIKTAIIAIVLIAMPLIGGAQTEDVTWSWEPPTAGSSVVEYVVETSVRGGPWEEIARTINPVYVQTVEWDAVYLLRVAGVDSHERQGPYSPVSEPCVCAGPPPGPPTQPSCEGCSP